MRKILATASAGALALGLAAAAPSEASANPLLLAPAALAWIIGGSIAGGVVVGSAAASAHPVVINGTPTAEVVEQPAYVAPTAEVVEQPAYVAPSTVVVQQNCYWTRGRVHGIWRRVQVCD